MMQSVVNKNFLSILISLLVAALAIYLFIFAMPYSIFSNVEFAYTILFLLGSIGLILIISNIYFHKEISLNWKNKIANSICFFLNSCIVFFALLGPPEVKGSIHLIRDNSIIIYVDEQYREEYNMDGSQLTAINGTTSSKVDDFIVYISTRTIVYEQYGNWVWQRKVVNINQIHEGQHILIKHNGWRHLSGSISEASVIIILNK